MSKKDEFMSPYWVEQRHDFLKERTEEEQLEILDSLNEYDIGENVNVREYQEDYIADYLSDLFYISEKSFWEHIKIMFQGEGVFFSDNMNYVDFIKQQEVDEELLQLILQSYLREENEYSKELSEDIIASQVEFDRNKKAIIRWSGTVRGETKQIITSMIKDVEANEWRDRF